MGACDNQSIYVCTFFQIFEKFELQFPKAMRQHGGKYYRYMGFIGNLVFCPAVFWKPVILTKVPLWAWWLFLLNTV